MSECQHCGSDVHEAFLCGRCLDDVERWLGDFPTVVDDLETTMAKLDRVSSGGKRGKGDEAPLVYRVSASEELWNVANTLGSWCRHLAESRGADIPRMPVDLLHRTSSAASAIHASRLLLAWRRTIPVDEAAGEIYDEIRFRYQQANRVIDAPEQKIYVGQCGAPLMFDVELADGAVVVYERDDHCPADLYARVTASSITCAECGASFDVADRQSELKGRLVDEWAHLDAIADALSRMSEPVRIDKLRSWVKKDRATAKLLASRGISPDTAGRPFLLARGKDDGGKLLYRVGDVLDRLAFSQTFERTVA